MRTGGMLRVVLSVVALAGMLGVTVGLVSDDGRSVGAVAPSARGNFVVKTNNSPAQALDASSSSAAQ